MVVEKTYLAEKGVQLEIKQGVSEINIKSDQLKQNVDNISTQIANKNTGKVLKTLTFTSNSTFTVPAGVTEVYITGGGAGGGGGGGGGAGATSGSAGQVTSFGNLLTLSGGGGGQPSPSSAGLAGGAGGCDGSFGITVGTNGAGGHGGSSGIYTGPNGGVGPGAKAMFCCGGAGGGSSQYSGGPGGGGGDFVYNRPLTVTPLISYNIIIGIGGSNGSLGVNGYSGGRGGNGILNVSWWE